MTVEKVLTSAVGLRKIKDQFWATDDSGSGHFPTHFHARLADGEDTSFWFGHRNEIIGLLVSRFPPAGPIVDIGGAELRASRGWRAVGGSVRGGGHGKKGGCRRPHPRGGGLGGWLSPGGV